MRFHTGGCRANQVLRSLISSISSEETDKEEDSKPDPSKPTYRFNVTCTIIQQGFSSKEGSTNVEARGRRGMHCASGAYWDTKHDGMWTYKHPVAEEKGMDLVLNIVWFGSLR
ncbi:dynein light chain (Tctex1), putative [Trichophyton benhamiae CBS 112371]|uniref:Dynein light chain (Tctex1), putative n=2 Tax=Trichophyton TaxID=5550 RepID=D4AUT0_ARTBC|nr:dynein light chain (Tctex1), putative [Trichophyton benhamiae CBS 112371]XP_003021295.1 dynein light chain (Tctex1), putative [Trichophyton verrucosum HKI 0517]EFE33245.1 dynein light chain (Tctex1), putative [Trichophyton benhamiae CBS 112371]EFE40677.1 dynein light chain (Tctex1), putative [Trichophyton verrucosum HKI 0517]